MLRDGGISGMELLYDGLGADVDRLALRGSAVRGGVRDRVAGRREVKPCGSVRLRAVCACHGTSPASGLAHREFGSNSAAASGILSTKASLRRLTNLSGLYKIEYNQCIQD